LGDCKGEVILKIYLLVAAFWLENGGIIELGCVIILIFEIYDAEGVPLPELA
jgi:hypothetical protein